mmetsp:Transcript_29442/g.44482  ORF Transcript_29442/g.44482 Transcript_29442/m.44482 type:complete len:151 (-) Transcript_29442:12-464(-)
MASGCAPHPTSDENGSTCSLEELLDRSHREGLDDGPCRLRLDDTNLAEHLALAGLRRRLQAGLDHAHAGQGDLARLLDLLLDDLSQAREDLHDIRLFELSRRRHCLSEASLRDAGDSLHGLHRLGCHGCKQVMSCKPSVNLDEGPSRCIT